MRIGNERESLNLGRERRCIQRSIGLRHHGRSRRILIAPSLVSLILVISIPLLTAFSLQVKQRLFGIWKLTTDCLPYETTDIRSKLKGLVLPESSPSGADGAILLKLNPDGTFKQCNEGYQEGRWITGRWKVLQEVVATSPSDKDSSETRSSQTKLFLAMNRQYYGPQFDIVLEGMLDVDSPNETVSSSLTINGTVHQGKYLHPPTHPAFFEPPYLANSKALGPCRLEQAIASQSIIKDDNMYSDSEKEDVVNRKKLAGADFHDKKFLMTIEPLEASQKQSDQPVDFRTMPIRFFSNNTFSAVGVDKILRGRFQVQNIDSNDDDGEFTQELFMQVSLFGAGRSAPGSVYSEGLGLTHEDARTYIGTIQLQVLDDDKSTRLYVQGTVFFGTDLGEDARPEPVARFYLSQDTSSGRGTPTVLGNGKNLATSLEEDNDIGARGIFE